MILLTDLHAFFAPDVTVENLDIVELGRLLQLVLGCAVNCEDKQGTVFCTCMNSRSALVLSLCYSLNSNPIPCCTHRIHSGYYVYGRICTTCSYDGNSRGQLLSPFQFVLYINFAKLFNRQKHLCLLYGKVVLKQIWAFWLVPWSGFCHTNYGLQYY